METKDKLFDSFIVSSIQQLLLTTIPYLQFTDWISPLQMIFLAILSLLLRPELASAGAMERLICNSDQDSGASE